MTHGGHRPLLVTGPARSGTTLVARLLAAHPEVEIAVDPLFPLVRAARNRLVAGVDPPLSPSSPLQDNHGSAARVAWLDAVVGGDLAAPLAPGTLDGIRAAIAERCAIESPDLVDLAEGIDGPGIAAALVSFLDAVAARRAAPPGAVLGLKEVWAADLVPPFLRALPGARAILVRRDPRAVLASNLGMARHDPSQVAHPLSVLRHWRKQEAIAAWTASRPELSGRVMTLVYEDLLRSPQAVLAEVFGFLGVPDDPGVLDPGRMRDAHGRPFVANSSFGTRTAGLAPELADRWRRSLDPERVALVELACGAEMEACGYPWDTPGGGAAPGPELLAQIAADDAREWSWRSDLREPALDFALEVARRRMAHAPEGALPADAERHLFLFPEARRALSAGRRRHAIGAAV